MKTPLKHCLVLVLFLGTTLGVANAVPIQLPGPNIDIPKNGTGPGGGNGNSDADNFFRAQTQITLYNTAHPLTPIPTALSADAFDLSTFSNVTVTGFDYAVLHYGVGNGGNSGSGGGVEIFYLNGQTGTFSFPANGTGTNGFGGWSSGVLFHGAAVTAPDGGATAMLLGVALLALGLTRRLVAA